MFFLYILLSIFIILFPFVVKIVTYSEGRITYSMFNEHDVGNRNLKSHPK